MSAAGPRGAAATGPGAAPGTPPDVGPSPAIVAGRTGILGGTFDPVHLGHLAIAEEAREALGMERVLFVPAGRPPHKPGQRLAPVADRVAMVEVAIDGNPAFRLSRVEVDRPGPSFAADTVEILAAAERAAGREPDLWWILSAEAFAAIASWRDPARRVPHGRRPPRRCRTADPRLDRLVPARRRRPCRRGRRARARRILLAHPAASGVGSLDPLSRPGRRQGIHRRAPSLH
jgi:cytidyltransferase-like protein